MRSLVLIALCAAVSAKAALAGGPAAEGIWTDENRQHVYSFLENDQLTYWSRTKYHADPAASYLRHDGRWEAKEPLCWLGKHSGNVMLYTEDQKCCMAVEAQGDKLILTPVWGDPQAGIGICENRVLSRIDNVPADVDPTTAERAR